MDLISPPRAPVEAGARADLLEQIAALLIGRSPAPAPTTDADWARLIALAQEEDVGPLLAWSLGTHARVDLPPSAREQLAAIYQGAIAASLLLQSLRTRICRRLTERGIPVLLLKGAALAFTCYEDPATRPMGDLDLLVPRSQLPDAARCLEENNFRLVSLPSSLLPLMNRPHRHLVYVERNRGMVVELHWEVQLPRRALAKALPEIWSCSRPLRAGEPERIMDAGHAIPFLCAHMSLQHKRASLLWLYDLHRLLLAAEDTEIRRAERAATEWGAAAATAQVLLRVQALFGTPLSEPLRQWVRDAARRGGLQARVAQRSVDPESGGRVHSGLLNLLLNGDWRFLRSTLPAPQVLRARVGLTPEQSVLPAYAALLRHYLSRMPAQARQFWHLWFH